jgi:hypothetical protein
MSNGCSHGTFRARGGGAGGVRSGQDVLRAVALGAESPPRPPPCCPPDPSLYYAGGQGRHTGQTVKRSNEKARDHPPRRAQRGDGRPALAVRTRRRGRRGRDEVTSPPPPAARARGWRGRSTSRRCRRCRETAAPPPQQPRPLVTGAHGTRRAAPLPNSRAPSPVESIHASLVITQPLGCLLAVSKVFPQQSCPLPNRCLEILREELELTMAFCGCRSLREVSRSTLTPAASPAAALER